MSWYNKYLSVYGKPYDPNAYKDIIGEIRTNLDKLQSNNPLATVSVIAYNEERHLLACLWALSQTKTKYPIEIIGVNNDSNDKTEQIYKDLGLTYFNEKRHSCGYARQCGLNNAKGKYSINIDADTMYPESYVETVINFMENNPKAIGVSATWSYIPDKNHSKFGIFLYTKIRNLYLFFQSFKRPELSVRGMVFSYHTKEAQEVGIRTHIIRGEDGALAFGLRKYGELHFLYGKKVRAITGYGTLSEPLLAGFVQRALQAFKNIKHVFVKATEYIDSEDNLIDKSGKKQ